MNSGEQNENGIIAWKEKLSFIKVSKEKRDKIVIMFLLGVFFLLVATPVSSLSPKRESKKSETTEISEKKIYENGENDAYIEQLENKLEQTIEGMEGVGKVHVMITLESSGEKILDKNQPYESSSEVVREEGKESEQSAIQSESETVLIDVDGDTSPIVVQERYPRIEGVVVVCEGGDNTAISLRIKEAVQALFSIDAHKIVVCKLQQ